MTERFLTILIFSIIFGAVFQSIWTHAPGIAVFVAATLGAQVYLLRFETPKKKIEVKKFNR